MQGTQSGRRRWGAGFLLLACALCLFASLAAPPSPAHAASSGTLVLNAPDQQPSAGDTFAVTIDLDGAAGVHEFNAYLLYNPNVVQVLDADPSTAGTQVLPGPFPGGGSVTANSAAGGSIQYAYALPGNAEASGSGISSASPSTRVTLPARARSTLARSLARIASVMSSA